MSWTLLGVVVLVLGFSFFVGVARRAELARMGHTVRRRKRAEEQGSAAAQLQYPVVDLSRCLGCATCVAICPEDGVLELVHGQAMVVNGARCKGISACERECPVGAITVTLQNLEERRDIPALNPELEAIGCPGLFLAGELTAHALIKTAVDHGTAVASEVARRKQLTEVNGHEVLDLCVVGAGPAGLACSLEAKRHGLSFVTLDQEERPGGTIAKYPRRKLVLTQPIDMPLHGRLANASYTKEELMALWEGIVAEQQIPVRCGETFQGLERDENGFFVVRTQVHSYRARNVCLALGRRGTPNKLGVPGEDLPKVAYSLLDAHSFQMRRILVVGGGDTAVEAALALAEQPGNEVCLSYRKQAFFRIRQRNEERIEQAIQEGSLRVLHGSQVQAIHEHRVQLTVETDGRTETRDLPNDEVFVMVGGVTPIDLLERSGVSFDPSLREVEEPLSEQGTGLTRALGFGFALSLLALLFALWNVDYYLLSPEDRPSHDKHILLRPSMGTGLWLGISATLLICLNLLYLVRRSPNFRLSFGSLQGWMTSHVATGILAFLCATLHAAMGPRDTAGGHAYWALVVLLISGAIGRYFYAYVPRAANGRELELEEAKARLSRMASGWDPGQRLFSEFAAAEVGALVEKRQWKSSFPGRVLALLGIQFGMRRVLKRIAREGETQGVGAEQVKDTMRLARQAYRSALMVAHYEDLRAVLNSWRWLHRWVAALMVLLLIIHVIYALAYGSFFDGGGV